MKLPILLASTILLLTASAAWADTQPTADQLDRFMLEQHPPLRYEMKGSHFLGLVGIGNVAGEDAYMTDLAGWSYWNQRFYASLNLGSVMISPKLFGLQQDPQHHSDLGNLLIPIGEAVLGYNIVGIRDNHPGLEPLWNLNHRTFVTIGAGTAAGFTYTNNATFGFGMTAGPFLGLRYKLMDWHNLNVYGHYLYGLNRLVDSYELGLHTSFGSNVIEIGYRGGELAAYLQRTSAGDVLLNPAPMIPYGAYFIRFAEGY